MEMDGLVAGDDHKRDIISLFLCISLFLWYVGASSGEEIDREGHLIDKDKIRLIFCVWFNDLGE